MDIPKTFNVFDIYPNYDDEPLYPNLDVDSRLSLSQVKENDTECLLNIFVNQIDRTKLKKKFGHIKRVF